MKAGAGAPARNGGDRGTDLASPFDPERGTPIVRPPGGGAGFWAGAPAALFDSDAESFYLCYRMRKPRGHGKDERGFELRIAHSTDGERYEDVWSMHKESLASSSMERAALVKVAPGRYRLYVSYVDPADNRWRIDGIEAESPASFDATQRVPVLTAGDVPGAEGVKDPYVVKVGSRYHLYCVYARPLDSADRQAMHETGDVHNTGHATASTGLAVSDDGLHFDWVGTVLRSGLKGWDRYQARLTTILPCRLGNLALWDGSATVSENYEEKAGLAVTYDLHSFAKISVDGPALETVRGGSVRYVDALSHEGSVRYFYEYARQDGAHELRLCTVPAR